jgi:hypothetical protein
MALVVCLFSLPSFSRAMKNSDKKTIGDILSVIIWGEKKDDSLKDFPKENIPSDVKNLIFYYLLEYDLENEFGEKVILKISNGSFEFKWKD